MARKRLARRTASHQVAGREVICPHCKGTGRICVAVGRSAWDERLLELPVECRYCEGKGRIKVNS